MRKFITGLCLLLTTTTFAASPEAALDARATRLEEQLRCLVCQNQSIAESQADLAMDLKRQVREMLVAGKSEAEVRDYMVERYGDFVLYDPPMQTGTLLLWLGPFLLLLGALGAFFWRLRQRGKAPADTMLDPAELARAHALLNNDAPHTDKPA
ncbi:hypothetical protein GCM10027046_28620 [Uliginosibacterium flavum]|uniref:Cytochrome c-type biogenesis protein n=1 Tax=Uliginosibacterium flavum TaxID=1396831 RepID=A0ABV2TJB5_9RHOO